MMTYQDSIVVLANCDSDLAAASARYFSGLGASLILVNSDETAPTWIAEFSRHHERAHIIEGNRETVIESIRQLPRVDTLITFPLTLNGSHRSELELATSYVSETCSMTEVVLSTMVKAGQGRVVNIISNSGIYGSRTHPHIAAAFAAINAYTQSFAQTVRETDVHLNAMTAFTRATMNLILDDSHPGESEFLDDFYVLPVIAYLGHRDCPLNGEILSAGGGRFARYVSKVATGYFDQHAQPQDIAENLERIFTLDHAVSIRTAADELFLIKV